ncbi:MAG TPA: DUF72 domain-containing protein [Anaerolineae bacterium]|nr:DUF72 domain-containing protein [Anaerolineae bacterium]
MSNSRKGKLLLGTQGFSFDDWVGPFYPEGTPKRRYLEAYAQRFPSVEIDSSFYGTPRATTVQSWHDRTPDHFRFSAKFPRLITHDKKLEQAEADAHAFVDTMQILHEKLAVLILQFAYDFSPDLFERLEVFLDILPGDVRYAVEVRNRKWLTPELSGMLSDRNMALVLQDLHTMPKLDWITADFTLIRWLGRRKDVSRFDGIQIDRTTVLEGWAEKVRRFMEGGVDVYGYFNNHFAGHSPASVRQFADLMDITLETNADAGKEIALREEKDDA